jgi:starch synthase
MRTQLRVLMMAAENDGLTGGKVGGIGDVVRDVPPALARKGCEVTIVTPSHGFLQKSTGAQVLESVSFDFAGQRAQAELYRVPGKQPFPGVTHVVIDHASFLYVERGRPQIYRNDPEGRAFASDAAKFALFCTAVAEAIRRNLLGPLHCIHLHDWHAAFLLILRKYHPTYLSLGDIRTAYTIHNLALQGVRPFEGDESSMAAWFPGLSTTAELADPRWPNCLNPSAVGIRFADAVHTVSPSYAEEILNPCDHNRFCGGEGLEGDLSNASRTGRLFGILNGCEYPEGRTVPRLAFLDLLKELSAQLLKWIATQGTVAAAHFIAYERLRHLMSVPDHPTVVLTSVSRIVDQKMFLLRESNTDGKSGLEAILEAIGDHGVYILLGTGDPQYEAFLIDMSVRHENFVFLNGYSDSAASALYASGDLFVMPSSYEPCGISQMLAMRDAQPCLVHRVGGLKDTVDDGVNGFAFEGETVKQQVDGLRDACQRAVELKRNDIGAWRRVCNRASAARFLWDDAVSKYVTHLYGGSEEAGG